ncbi:UNVERIFIED_CONTAM: Oligoribonuclease [Sesamum angustifolium]|uniref:Oligoribonuclease n=1 Tax=Sesamum angustifolium TaxID=2727405 RepID=A0AAW2QQ23_9LAMI
MNQLSNAFSLLELDVEDAREQITVPTASDVDKREDNCSGDGRPLKNENGDKRTLELIPGTYKMPLVWIDLEMTGLNIEVDRILEIACVITDGNLTKSVEGPHLVIHQQRSVLIKWENGVRTSFSQCHTKFCWCSGLTKNVLRSKISEQEAEKRVVEFVKRNVGAYTPLIAGNSVYMDLLFLRKYMPNLAVLFSHVVVDVSSVKALCLRWYPRDSKKAPQKENKHRAMDDIKESIAELKFYKDHIFKPSKSRK